MPRARQPAQEGEDLGSVMKAARLTSDGARLPPWCVRKNTAGPTRRFPTGCLNGSGARSGIEYSIGWLRIRTTCSPGFFLLSQNWEIEVTPFAVKFCQTLLSPCVNWLPACCRG